MGIILPREAVSLLGLLIGLEDRENHPKKPKSPSDGWNKAWAG